tara:strand:- start:27 stop:464 length:438 start_codon:yes stop_codon:yes gene_type:complete
MIDYTKPIRVKKDTPGTLTVEQILSDGSAFVHIERDDRYCGGLFLFDKNGEFHAHIPVSGKPCLIQGSGLTLENVPEEKEVFVRVSSVGYPDPTSLHRTSPEGDAVASIRLKVVDGIVKSAEVVRENKEPLTRAFFAHKSFVEEI